MAQDAYFGSAHQFQNQMLEDPAQMQSSTFFFQDGHSSLQGASINLCPSGAQMPYQNGQSAPREININILANPTNSGVVSFGESPSISVRNSSMNGGPYSVGRVDSLSISGLSNGDHNSAQWQGVQICNPTSVPQVVMPVNQTSVSPIMNKKPRLERQYNESLSPHNLQHMSISQAMQMKNYNDRLIAARMHHQQQHPSQIPSLQQAVVNSNGINRQPSPHQQAVGNVQKQLPSLNQLNGALCIQELMAYLNYRRKKIPENSIEYWKKLVEHYFNPGAIRRLCLSKFALNVSSQSTTGGWKCELCETAPAKGFVEAREVFPKMFELYFSKSGVVDELLYLDAPLEKVLPSGHVVLFYPKAVQESIYKHFRVIHEGSLRIIFTQEKKILSWDFCIQRHEELLSRKLLSAQLNEVVKDAVKSQNNADSNENDRAQNLDPQSLGNRLAAAGHRFAAMVELSQINEVGFSKHFVRNLQIAEVVNSMKGLMTCSITNNLSPIETLKIFRQESANRRAEIEGRSQMQHTPVPNYSNLATPDVRRTGNADHVIQATNHMPQTPISRDQAMLYCPGFNQKPVQDMSQGLCNTTLLPYSPSLQNPVSSAQRTFSLSFGEDLSTEKAKLNSVLASMRKQRTKRERPLELTAKNNGALNPYDQGAQSLHASAQNQVEILGNAVQNVLTTANDQGVRAENGKVFKTCCSRTNTSSGSSKHFPDCSFIKRSDKDLDEDHTSLAVKQDHQ